MSDQTVLQQEMLINRLKKRRRHLWKWAKRNDITCFRLYDRDIPEIPFVIDEYEGHLNMAEYNRPHDRSPEEHAVWIEAMRDAAARGVGVPLERVFLKARERQRGSAQYEKLDQQQVEVIGTEHGLKFILNMSDYVDTGLFLDHRTTRRYVMDMAFGARMLNLFAYTGSFSVYAAAGGAEHTLSVDLSNTYCDWARRNLDLNGPFPGRHEILCMDVFSFLKEAVTQQQRYDVIVLDPPTFSNSKKMDGVLDVQRDHPQLIDWCYRLLAPQGTLLFSTNFRKFKLDTAGMPRGAAIRELTPRTIPEDFRNQKIHRCWEIIRER
ncbi:class I SAM-dependent methyltransferase [Spirochaeta africana]|uniref:class I SAM-dependent methyltransferase n=1 Tax=Spirochaeta africana TaxID=46355 RepID=UPI000247493A|nr:class I SAM-dependent methyltransferase [Spirochaeta africana]